MILLDQFQKTGNVSYEKLITRKSISEIYQKKTVTLLELTGVPGCSQFFMPTLKPGRL